MGKRSYSRIFIEKKGKYFKLMNIAHTSDESIILTFYKYKNENAFLFYTKEALNPNDITVVNETKNPKISFHKSGIVKLCANISRNKRIFDRISLQAVPFSKIKKSRRMMDVFVPPPPKLKEAKKNEFDGKQDIVLNANSFPNKQWRIALFCSSRECFNKLSNPKWVSTSECETYASLERANLVWTWVLRISALDKGKRNSLDYYIFADKILWPKGNK